MKTCAVLAGCATVAEVRKRGDDFWGEFEFYLSDLVVGCVLDCVLVGLLAPSAVIGAKPKTKPTGEPKTSFSRVRLNSRSALYAKIAELLSQYISKLFMVPQWIEAMSMSLGANHAQAE